MATNSLSSVSGLASGIQWRDMIEQIISLESSRRMTPVTSRITAQQKRREAWETFEGLMDTLAASAGKLKDGSAFSAHTVISGHSPTSDQELVSASAGSGASPGSYGVEVVALARNEKLRGGTAITSLTEARSLAGTFHVNGKPVTLEATDSLAMIRDKINAVNSGSSASGVTAGIVSVSATEHYLSLTADAAGTRGVELVDSGNGSSTNGVLAQLGLLTGAQTANLSGAATETQRFTSKDSAIATLLGLSAPPAQAAINVNGVRIEVNLLSDSLTDLLDKIQAAGQSATMVTEQVSGSTRHRLSTSAITVNTDVGNNQDDSRRIIELLGFVKGARAQEIQAGVDARITLDGLTVTRRTNAISDAIGGVTLDLKAQEPGTTVSVNISRDNATIVNNVKGFADAFNRVLAFQKSQRSTGGPLASDGALRATISSFKNVLLTDVEGINSATTDFTRTAVAGLLFTDTGTLEVDSAVLTAALETNFNEVKTLFSTSGVATHSAVSFFSADAGTVPGTYAVNITQAATVPSATGAPWAGAYDGSGADTMRVYDAYTGDTVDVPLVNGSTIDTVIAALNDGFDAAASSLTASKTAGGELVITGSTYGTAGSFTVSYLQGGAAWGGASPTGLTAGTYAGLNVAGTIGGFAATGSGQRLTVDDGTDAAGLSILYSGAAAGAAGSITYVEGIGGAFDELTDEFTRAGDGLLALYLQTIDDSIASLSARQETIQARLDRYEEQLVRQFTAMEAAMAEVQATGNWLANQISAMQSATRQ